MWGGGGMWVRSDVTSGRNRRWEWRLDAGDAEDGKTTSDASGRGARTSDAGLIFADEPCWCIGYYSVHSSGIWNTGCGS